MATMMERHFLANQDRSRFLPRLDSYVDDKERADDHHEENEHDDVDDEDDAMWKDLYEMERNLMRVFASVAESTNSFQSSTSCASFDSSHAVAIAAPSLTRKPAQVRIERGMPFRVRAAADSVRKPCQNSDRSTATTIQESVRTLTCDDTFSLDESFESPETPPALASHSRLLDSCDDSHNNCDDDVASNIGRLQVVEHRLEEELLMLNIGISFERTEDMQSKATTAKMKNAPHTDVNPPCLRLLDAVRHASLSDKDLPEHSDNDIGIDTDDRHEGGKSFCLSDSTDNTCTDFTSSTLGATHNDDSTAQSSSRSPRSLPSSPRDDRPSALLLLPPECPPPAPSSDHTSSNDLIFRIDELLAFDPLHDSMPNSLACESASCTSSLSSHNDLSTASVMPSPPDSESVSSSVQGSIFSEILRLKDLELDLQQQLENFEWLEGSNTFDEGSDKHDDDCDREAIEEPAGAALCYEPLLTDQLKFPSGQADAIVEPKHDTIHSNDMINDVGGCVDDYDHEDEQLEVVPWDIPPLTDEAAIAHARKQALIAKDPTVNDVWEGVVKLWSNLLQGFRGCTADATVGDDDDDDEDVTDDIVRQYMPTVGTQATADELAYLHGCTRTDC